MAAKAEDEFGDCSDYFFAGILCFLGSPRSGLRLADNRIHIDWEEFVEVLPQAFSRKPIKFRSNEQRSTFREKAKEVLKHALHRLEGAEADIETDEDFRKSCRQLLDDYETMWEKLSVVESVGESDHPPARLGVAAAYAASRGGGVIDGGVIDQLVLSRFKASLELPSFERTTSVIDGESLATFTGSEEFKTACANMTRNYVRPGPSVPVQAAANSSTGSLDSTNPPPVMPQGRLQTAASSSHVNPLNQPGSSTILRYDHPPSHSINHLLADLPELISHLLSYAKKTKKFLTCDFGKLHKLRKEEMKLCWKTSVVPIILMKAIYNAVHSPKTTSAAQCRIVPNQTVLLDVCRQFSMIVTSVGEIAKMLETICLEPEDIEAFIRLLYVGFVYELDSSSSKIHDAHAYYWGRLPKQQYNKLKEAVTRLASDVAQLIADVDSSTETLLEQYRQSEDFQKLAKLCVKYRHATGTAPK